MDEEQESEFSSDKAVVFQNRLQWSVSTKKFPVSIKVIEDNGKMYLDPALITWSSPKDSFGTGFPPPPVKLTNLQEKWIEITSELNQTIQSVVRAGIDRSITGDSVEEKYASLVITITEIWNSKRADGTSISSREMDQLSGIATRTWQNILHVSYYAGLFHPHTRGKVQRAPKILSLNEKKVEENFTKWKEMRPDGVPVEESPVNIWIKKNRTADAPEPQKTLHKAMKIMQVNPVTLYNLANEKPQHKAIEKLEDLVIQKRMPDPRNAKNILPKKFMVKDNGDLVLPKTLQTATGKYPRVWFYGYWDQMHGGIKNPNAPPNERKALYDPKLNPNKYVNKLWSLRDWGNSFDAPDPFGTVIDKGKYKGVWSGTPRSKLTQEAIKLKQNNAYYNMIGVIRQFMGSQGLVIPDMPEDSPLAQIANIPRKASIHLKVSEIEIMNDCLIKGMHGGIIEFDDWDTFYVKRDNIKFKDVKEAKSFWHDAYFYFKLGLDLGFRAEEAFTLVAQRLDTNVIGSAKAGESGVFEFSNGDMSVTLYQRKAEHGAKGQKIHGGYIIAPETKQLIKDRLKEVEEGMQETNPEIAFEKFGVIKEHNDDTYLQHSLIGADGKYTALGTLDLPASIFGQEAREKGRVRPTAQREKVRAMLRHCYHEAGLKDDYWYKHSLHSVRHVFAQYWLNLSDYNYGFVADIGHWQTESIVKSVYGKKTETYVLDQMTNFAGTDPLERLREKEKQAKTAPSATGAQGKFTQNFYGQTEESMELEDQKLVQEIFFVGGYYFDVRLDDEKRLETQKLYPKGTDIQFTKKDTELKRLFTKQSAVDKTLDKDINK